MALEGATMQVKGPMRWPSKAHRCPLKGQRWPLKAQRCRSKGQRRPSKAQRCPSMGQRRPVKAQRCRSKGQRRPLKGQRCRSKGQRRPSKGQRCRSKRRGRHATGVGAVRCPVRAGSRCAHRRRSLLQACDDFRHAKSQFELKAYVFALLARQVAPHLDTHILGLQNAQEPGHRRAYGVRPVTCLAQSRSQKGFDVHVASRSVEVLHCVPTGTCAA